MTPVRTLLEIPELRLRLRSGATLLDREVSRIYGTELPDPSRYLSAGELVLTGLLWWRDEDDAEPFVSALADAGATALAASGADTDGIPTELVRACERHRIPLLEVPPDLSFAVITERVVLALAGDREDSPGARKRLLSAATEHASLPELLRHGAAELDAPCWVLSATGRIVASGGPEPLDATSAARAFVEAGGRTVVQDGLTSLPLGDRSPLPWLLVVGGDRADRPPARAAVAEELASLVALDRSRSEQIRGVTDRLAAPLLRLVGGAALSEGELSGGLGATGLTTDTALRVLLLRAPEPVRGVGVQLLVELLAEHPGRSFVGELTQQGDQACALVEADEWPQDWAETATAALSAVEPLLRGGQVLVGIGGPATIAGLRGASEEARHALALAARGTDRIAVVSGEQIGTHQLLLAGVADELRHSVRRRTLGPLLAYDEAQQGDLVRTVRVFLECSGSPGAAAKALHVHVNTLRYRITRASELLGKDLTDFPTQVDVYLALCISDREA